MRKHELKALGLALMAVMGLMAFWASQAQAITPLNVIMKPQTSIPGVFLINSGTKTPLGLTHETVAVSSALQSRLIMPTAGLEIDCTNTKLTGSPFIENEYEDWSLATPAVKAGGHGVGEATFTGCKVYATSAAGVKGVEIPACSAVVKSEGQAVGTIVAKGLLRVVRHPEGPNEETPQAYIVLEPQVTSAATAKQNTELLSKFTKLVFGGICADPAAVDIHGGLVIKAPTTDVNKPSLSVKSWEVSGGVAVLSAEQKLLGAELTFGVIPAFVEANSVIAELTGANSAASWGMM